ncbi:MAG TPA: PDR/VanB family oxidoreductase [Pseudonocardiaceae bacterium]|nr:PDR/VanB family oxidoreductase [Pseudonocardiaceae bacterium]
MTARHNVGTSAEEMNLRVLAIREEAEDVRSYVLADPDGAELPAWEPGAHIDLLLPGELVRQYSLCGRPGERGSYRVAVLRADNGRGGSRLLHERVRIGDELKVGRPRNNFPLAEAAGHLFVAGGIGITPLLPMIHEVAALGADWRLYYGGRSRSRMAFLGELAALAEADARVRVLPEDEHGLLPLAEILGGVDDTTVVHCCGPEPLLQAVERVWAGRPADSLRTERFQAREDLAPSPDRTFEVVVSSSGRIVPVAVGESIMDVLGAAGIDVPFSCREGTCGSCETAVLDGEVEHRDSVLSEAEQATNTTMMLCVSRARSARLVLDL